MCLLPAPNSNWPDSQTASQGTAIFKCLVGIIIVAFVPLSLLVYVQRYAMKKVSLAIHWPGRWNNIESPFLFLLTEGGFVCLFCERRFFTAPRRSPDSAVCVYDCNSLAARTEEGRRLKGKISPLFSPLIKSHCVSCASSRLLLLSHTHTHKRITESDRGLFYVRF